MVRLGEDALAKYTGFVGSKSKVNGLASIFFHLSPERVLWDLSPILASHPHHYHRERMSSLFSLEVLSPLLCWSWPGSSGEQLTAP